MDLASVIGTLAALASTTSFAPQAWKMVRTRDTSAVSTRMYAITVVGFALWLAYGVLLAQWPLIVTNAVCLGLSAFILAMKLLPERKRRRVAAALAGADQRS
jgi:MtN3 and saliva related transmembrane protein